MKLYLMVMLVLFLIKVLAIMVGLYADKYPVKVTKEIAFIKAMFYLGMLFWGLMVLQ